MDRLVVWSGLDAERWEVVELSLGDDGLAARGTQVGVEPLPYRLDYVLEAPDNFVTRLMDVRVRGDRWSRRLLLRHDGRGGWSQDVELDGTLELEPAGVGRGSMDELVEARDCDLGLSPLTNIMPVRRNSLTDASKGIDIVVAWISVPDLGLRPYRQRYEFVRRSGHGSIVRFIDLGLSEGFTADLMLDADGVVEVYPGLARRVDGTNRQRI
jgi:uncharacterized protein